MTELVLLLLCSKKRSPHVVGSVVMDSSGLTLRFKEAMRVNTTGRDADDFKAIDSEYVPVPNLHGCSDAYCAPCGQRYFMPVNQIFAAAERGRPKGFRLQGLNPEAAFRRKPPDVH